jgi:hypothetical protein
MHRRQCKICESIDEEEMANLIATRIQLLAKLIQNGKIAVPGFCKLLQENISS